MKKTRFIDERGFLFGKIGVIDLLAVLLVLALGLMVAVRFGLRGEGGERLSVTDTVPVRYVLRIRNARTYLADAVNVGDEVFTDESGVAMGKIVDKSVTESRLATTMNDGTVEYLVQEECCDIYLTMEADATAGAGAYYVDGKVELLLNATILMDTAYAGFYAEIYSVG